jgi:ATP-dependent protease ClpP protease subunit
MASPKRRTISQRSEMIYDAQIFGITVDTRELFIGPGGIESYRDNDTAMIDYLTANQFIRNLRILNSMGNDPILVHSITCGGDWNYGIAIYDAIKNSCDDPNLSNIVVLSHAHARSMSSVIPQAATYRVLMPNADFLIHSGTLGLDGNATSVLAEADWAKRIEEIMLDIYVDRCYEGGFWLREGITERKQIKEYLRTEMARRQEWYMTPREAVDKGFVDAILGDEGFETIKALREDE